MSWSTNRPRSKYIFYDTSQVLIDEKTTGNEQRSYWQALVDDASNHIPHIWPSFGKAMLAGYYDTVNL